jgi:hypothetical protein
MIDWQFFQASRFSAAQATRSDVFKFNVRMAFPPIISSLSSHTCGCWQLNFLMKIILRRRCMNLLAFPFHLRCLRPCVCNSVLHCRSTREDLRARTPDSEDDDNSPPASASSKAKAKPARSSRTTSSGHIQMQTPLPSGDRNKKDKGLREFSLRVCRQVEVRLLFGQKRDPVCVASLLVPFGIFVWKLTGSISLQRLM